MTDIYCHVHTPMNIEEESKNFLQPVIFKGTLYIVKERKLHDALAAIGYLGEYLKFVREHGYGNVLRWINKKNLLNEWFLEGISQYWITDIQFKNVSNYKFFKKNDSSQPVISGDYLKNLCRKVILYNYIKADRDKFNEEAEKELGLIKNELSYIRDEKSLKIRRHHYKNNIFNILIDNFFADIKPYVKEKLQEIENIDFFCETFLSTEDIFVYKTSNINAYKDCSFKLVNTSYEECIKGNTFIKLCSRLKSRYSDEDYLMYVLENIRADLEVFTCDKIDFGAEFLKKTMGHEENLKNVGSRRRNENAKYFGNNDVASSVAMLQKTQTIISETENHIISRYYSLKNHSNIYFASNEEMVMNIAALSLDGDLLKMMDHLIWEKPNNIEARLVKFAFNSGNLPYSPYGYGSINF